MDIREASGQRFPAEKKPYYSARNAKGTEEGLIPAAIAAGFGPKSHCEEIQADCPEDEGGVEGEADHRQNGDHGGALVTDSPEHGPEDEGGDEERDRRGDFRVVNLRGLLQGEEPEADQRERQQHEGALS